MADPHPSDSQFVETVQRTHITKPINKRNDALVNKIGIHGTAFAFCLVVRNVGDLHLNSE